MSSPFTAALDGNDDDGVNFGGGGGIVLGRGGGIMLDAGTTNFFGAGIVDTFLTLKSADCSTGLFKLEPCSELGRKDPRMPQYHMINDN